MVISLFSIILIVIYSFLNLNNNVYLGTSKISDSSINTRIAMEYLIDRITNSKSIKLQELGKAEVSVSHLRVETREGSPTNILYIDGERIYIKKDKLKINGKEKIENILRCDTDSQQVVPGIYAFEVWDLGNGLYQIALFLDNPRNHEDSEYPGTHFYSSYVKKRS